MHCVEFEMRLNDLLDERAPLGGDSLLESHAAECSQCADLLGAHMALLDGVEALACLPLRSDLAVRVAAELAPAASRRSRSWLWALMATAAALLVSLGVWRWRVSADSAVPSVASPPNSYAAFWITEGTRQATADFGVREWTLMEQVADGLKPVGESMSAAWETLRRTTWPHSPPGTHSS
jgi:hypothetical protein